MNKIKICFIQTNVYHFFYNNLKSTYGGSEFQLYLLSKELVKDCKFLVSFIVGDFGQKKIEEKDNNILLYKSCTPKSNDSLIIKFIQAIKYYYLFKKINADIYFTSTANSISGIVSFFCKMNKKKHIHRTAHQMDVDKSFIKSNGLLGKIYKYGLENSDIIITQCNEHKDLIKSNHNIDSLVIKNSVEIKNNIAKKKVFILWVARYEEWKQPDVFIKLAKLFPEEKFLMICNKKEDKKNEWKEIRNNAIKTKNLKFIEKVSINKIQDYFDRAKVFINTSVYEGFPNSFIQAGIGKTPIISLNVNPDNFINNFNCGYFCNSDFNKMVQNLKKILLNKKDYEQKSSNIYKYVAANHDIKKNIIKLKTSIINLLKNENYSYSS